MTSRLRLVLWASLLWIAADLTAATGRPDSLFEQGNRAYEEGKFQEAAEAYASLLEQGRLSPALFLNLGNAWYRAGETGRAIAAYESGLKLAPRHEALQQNLSLVRERAGLKVWKEGDWRSLFQSLTLDEWTLLFAGTVWALLLLLAFQQIRTEAKLRPYYVVFGVCAGISLTGVLLLWFAPPRAIALQDHPLTRGPYQQSEPIETVRRGTMVEVVNQKGEWLQVVTPASQTGWIPAEATAPVRNPVQARI